MMRLESMHYESPTAWMAVLDTAIHAFPAGGVAVGPTWMRGTSPRMTVFCNALISHNWFRVRL
jgi:hypothetical protein